MLARVFVYVPPFISQILDLIYWTVLILILIYFEWRDTENQQYSSSTDLRPLPPSFLGRYISSVDPKWCLPLLWTLTITFLTSLSCSCFRSAIGQTWVHIKYHGRTGSVNWLNARDANFLLLSDGGLVQVTDVPCRRTFAAPFSTRWSSWLIFSINARNLKKDPCFKLCINSEPRGGGDSQPRPQGFSLKSPGDEIGVLLIWNGWGCSSEILN